MKSLLVIFSLTISLSAHSNDFDEIVDLINNNDIETAKSKVDGGLTSYIYGNDGKSQEKTHVHSTLKNMDEKRIECDKAEKEILEKSSSDSFTTSCANSSGITNNLDACKSLNSELHKLSDLFEKKCKITFECADDKYKKDQRGFYKCLNATSPLNGLILSIQSHSSKKITIFDHYNNSLALVTSTLSKTDDQIRSFESKSTSLENQKKHLEQTENDKANSIGMICQMIKMNAIGKKEIEKEKKAGKISGYVNASKLQELGSMIVNNEEHIETFKEKLLKNNKYKFKASDCK